MAITKRNEFDKIEIVGRFRIIQLRTATVIEEDGEEISRSFRRRVLTPDMDTSNLPNILRQLTDLLWTNAIKQAWQNFRESRG